MQLYRITKAEYADKLVASGLENRWNSAGRFVIYAAANTALACLENLVHTSGQLLYTRAYRLMIIEVTASATQTTIINLKSLPQNWQDVEAKSILQAIGNRWYDEGISLLMRVPSAIIPTEDNYLINTRHPLFSKLKIQGTLPFLFDRRLKAQGN